MKAIEQEILLLKYVIPYLIDRETYTCILKHMRPDLQTRDMCMKVLVEYPNAFRHVRLDLQDRDMCMFVLEKAPYMFPHIRPDLQDREMCMSIYDKHE
jgi:hypothetical protein